MKQKIETKKDGKDFARFDDLLRTVVKVPKDEIQKREKTYKQKKKAVRASANEPLYIAIDEKIMVYRLDRYEKKTNIAFLTLYKNLTDFHTDKPFRSIEVADW